MTRETEHTSQQETALPQQTEPPPLAVVTQAGAAYSQQSEIAVDTSLGQALRNLPVPGVDDPQRRDRGWRHIQQQLTQRRHRRRRWQRVGAVAALFLFTLGVWRLWPPTDVMSVDDAVTGTLADTSALSTQANPPAAITAEAATTRDELAALVGLSQHLESQWQSLRQRSQVLSGAEIERQMQLAGLIATVDARLTAHSDAAPDPEYQRELWRQRVVLMNELIAGEVQVEPAMWTL